MDRPIRSTRLLQRALAIAMTQRLYVFPVTPRGKTPAVKKWQDEATRDPDRIRAWFEAASYNIGISTGASNLLVVDLDDGHGATPPEPWLGARHGNEVLARLAAAAGEKPPTNTYTVTTPTGGLHLYFRQPEEISLRNSAGTLGWRIDTRGNGGYIVAAGSRRPEGFYRVTNPAPIAPLPNWLRDALTPPLRGDQPERAVQHLPGRRLTAYLQAAVTAECRSVSDAVVGTRHHTLLRAARILGELVGGGVLDMADARGALRAAAERHVGVDGCTAREIEQTIADGLSYGQQRPRRVQGGRPPCLGPSIR